ncbi:hypothetical protein WR25_07099 [Diploscapter pachys]|uniref:ACT domain-containing protein n=1 Tax=Diploscapter pachys TaxID=2018661 RepID=A0A2A2K1Q7_9BILA|nr:hypothetical protein WR25_07099 [Diploscapter pachys]
MDGMIQIDPMITHRLTLDEINKGFDLMHAGESIRSVTTIEERKTIMFSHVMLGANDIDASKAFYDATLGALGIAPGRVDPKGRILTLVCQDRVGIVAAVSGALAGIDGFILDSQQYADLETGRFFMRVAFVRGGDRYPAEAEALRAAIAPVAEAFGFDWSLDAAEARPRVLIAVSKGSHCLNDLLHRWRTKTLPVDIAGVVSNHDSLRPRPRSWR